MNCRSCGIEIHFDPTKKSKSGKFIPLEFNGAPHQCPNSKYVKPQKAWKYGFDFSEEEGFIRMGNFILHKWDFCKCGLYKGLLPTENGGLLCFASVKQ